MLSSVARFRSALVGTSTLIPVLASLFTLALYIGLPKTDFSSLNAIAGGALLTLIVWMFMAISYMDYTTARGADAYSYNLLITTLVRLRALTQFYLDERSLDKLTKSSIYDIYTRELQNYLEIADIQLSQGGTVWVSAIGYVIVSRLLHRAEEALIEIEPQTALIEDGSRIQVALENSTIRNKEYYLRTLERMLDYLNPGRFQHFQKSNGGKAKGDMVASPIVPSEAGEASEPSNPMHIAHSPDPFRESEARASIRQISNLLNESQDDQWEKLIHARNQLTKTTVLTGLTLYFLLAFAIVTIVPIPVLQSATFFFLIGAGVGLFSRLYAQSRSDSSIDNVRLAGVRLMAAPLFSGLAAIGGVVVMQKVAATSVSPSFDLNLFNILVAAAFGLTPNLFFSAIQKQVEAVDNSKKT